MASRLLNTIRPYVNKILQPNKKYVYVGICAIIGLNIPPPAPLLSQFTYIKNKINDFNDKKYVYSYNCDENKNLIPLTIECNCGVFMPNKDRFCYSFTVSILNNDIVNETLKNKLIKLISHDTVIDSSRFEILLKKYIEDIVANEVKFYDDYRLDGNIMQKEKLVDEINKKLCYLNYQIKSYDFDYAIVTEKKNNN
jgi:hypothetical protein